MVLVVLQAPVPPPPPSQFLQAPPYAARAPAIAATQQQLPAAAALLVHEAHGGAFAYPAAVELSAQQWLDERINVPTAAVTAVAARLQALHPPL